MNYDEYILKERETLYNRKKVMIDNIIKHFMKKCNCIKNNKRCALDNNKVIELNKLGEKEYLSNLYDDGVIDFFYNIFQSVTQSLRSSAGKDFEYVIEKTLLENDFKEHKDYSKQVFVSENNIIKEKKKKNENGHFIDFLIPSPKVYPMLMSQYKGEIISCKTTLRERVLQDKFLGNITVISLENINNKNIKSIKIDKEEKNYTKWLINLKEKYIKNKINMNVLDLFCGCGGFSYGFEKAGFKIIAGIDIWDKAVESFRENHKDSLGICEDLTKYKPEDLEGYLKENNKNTDIDIIIGGVPCQGFSMAGKRESNDPRNSLFMEYVKFLNYYKPKAFLFENVMGILSMKTESNELAIDIIMSHLNTNYNCVICKLYASDFEVPQNRRRVIIYGIRKDLNILPSEPIEYIKNISERIPVKSVLMDKELVDKKYYLSEKAIEGINRRKEKMKNENKGFGAQFLDLEKPSFTISSRYYKDGYDALIKYSETEIRRLTILELKRIQSFPDEYYLSGNNKEQIMQIGNAVAPIFAKHLGIHLKNLLNIVSIDSNIKYEKNGLETYTFKQLKDLCKKNHIKCYYKMNKSEMIDSLVNK